MSVQLTSSPNGSSLLKCTDLEEMVSSDNISFTEEGEVIYIIGNGDLNSVHMDSMCSALKKLYSMYSTVYTVCSSYIPPTLWLSDDL